MHDATRLPPRVRMQRRPVAYDIAILHVYGRFIDCQPVTNARQVPGYVRYKTRKQTDTVAAQPPARSREPGRIREVMERDQRFYSSIAQRSDNLNVMIQCIFIPHAFLWLDSTPLDGQAMGVMSPGLGEIEVFLIALIVIAGDSGLERQVAAPLVFPPVVPLVIPFDLMSGRRGAPKKRFRELEETVHLRLALRSPDRERLEILARNLA